VFRDGRSLRRLDVASHRYLIVGGGMTADAAVKGIRSVDADGPIVLVGEERHAPYARPPLSKGLWRDGADEHSVFRGTEEHGADLVLARRIVSLDLDARNATDDHGDTYAYDRLLLATGGSPRRLPSTNDGVVYFRTLDDFRLLKEAAASGARAVVIGGGFIGSEIAAALASTAAEVSLLFPEPGIGARLFPADLAAWLNGYYREHGVDVRAGERVSGIDRAGDGFRVTTESGGSLEAGIVVAGLGIEPRTDLAEAAGLPVEDGIRVDDRGRVGGRDDVFAAGDVARFPASALGIDLRIEHEDHAKSHGARVGANMAGADEPYDHLPFFYSDLFDLGYEAVGQVDSRLTTVAEWEKPNRTGIVGYVDENGRARGFLLWDVWGKVEAATELIRLGRKLDSAVLRALLR
jgi:3-phenylpropionate/trans-cinnamate dioxygenase ferredoxin reductase component